MGIKENVDAIKQELSAEEQFLESVIKAEGFWKKYKKVIIATFSLLVVAALVYAIYGILEEKKKLASNSAFSTLLKSPNDQEALATLKAKNPKLYQLFLFKNMMATKSDLSKGEITDKVLLDLMAYQSASSSTNSLATYAMNQDALLGEFAKIEEAYLALKNKKYKEAQTLLGQISQNSMFAEMAQSFKHYNQ